MAEAIGNFAGILIGERMGRTSHTGNASHELGVPLSQALRAKKMNACKVNLQHFERFPAIIANLVHNGFSQFAARSCFRLTVQRSRIPQPDVSRLAL